MIRLHIAYANTIYRLRQFGHRAYDATHVPDSRWLDDWADLLHAWNADPESLGGAYYKGGVLVRRTWAGLIRVNRAVA